MYSILQDLCWFTWHGPKKTLVLFYYWYLFLENHNSSFCLSVDIHYLLLIIINSVTHTNTHTHTLIDTCTTTRTRTTTQYYTIQFMWTYTYHKWKMYGILHLCWFTKCGPKKALVLYCSSNRTETTISHRNITKNSMAQLTSHHSYTLQCTALFISRVYTIHSMALQHTTPAYSTCHSSPVHFTAMHHTSQPCDTLHSYISFRGSTPHNMDTVHFTFCTALHGCISLHTFAPHIGGTFHCTALQHTSQEHPVSHLCSISQEFIACIVYDPICTLVVRLGFPVVWGVPYGERC